MSTYKRTLSISALAMMALPGCEPQVVRPDPAPIATPQQDEDEKEPPAYAALTWKQKCLSYVEDAQRACTNNPEICATQEYKDCINETSLCYALYDYGELPAVQVSRFNQVVAACKQYGPHIVG